MEVILLENLGKLGSIGDKAKVKAGYGRNYLVPQGKAVFATEKNLADFELRRADLEAAAAAKLAEANARAAKVTEIGSLTITAIAGDEGKLFGSVGTRELEDALNAAGAEVSKSEINLPEGALRNVGEYSVEVQLHTEVTASITVVIEAE
ncbi:50S ribosomal protein L9 [SAR92 clade bacterium H231]|jgi:large subunit ribosomal protein L9|nr:50S ribosomal protein L9 [Porticoccaceae bacterium]MCT2533898.1 50S ribosomal protein L9 [SAR92 clade bacterium H231]MBT7259339.1 50S ribosomal protein L9 [Porticoccaceae bacterium]MBT7904556.1 50S ribosomal protein L9 [Porticoccaceae bacterium]MDA7853991.1 50S ribosomal protein L9 [Porticoccaceae bacterium]